MQKAYYLSTPHLARSRTPQDLYKCVRARAFVCVCQNEGECMSEREREREGGAIHVLLIHSIFVVAFIIFFFFTLRTVYVF